MNSIRSFVAKRPWLYVVFAFLVLLAAWSTLITVAIKYSPQTVEISK